MNVLLFIAVALQVGVMNSEAQNEGSQLSWKDVTAIASYTSKPHSLRRVTREPCGDVFTATKGTITSPQFPQHYPSNKRCTYEIVAPNTHSIYLSFSHFAIEEGDDCTYDSVHVNCTTYNGTVHEHGPYCGYEAPPNISCEGNKMHIAFVSDDATEYSGFAAEFNTVHAACAKNNGGCKQLCEPNINGDRTCACRTGFVLHPDDQDCKEENPEGKLLHFHSDAHPNGSLIFSWKWRGGVAPSGLTGFYFKATSLNHTILITLPPTSTSFAADQLRGETEYDTTLWPFYNIEGASTEKLGKPSMLSVHTPVSEPCGGVFMATKATITSPNYPRNYPNNKRCTYEIVAPSSHVIFLTFNFFHIEGRDDCEWGEDIFEMSCTLNNGTVLQYGRYCGNNSPTNISCEGNKISILFASDDTIVHPGFSADVYMVHVACAKNNGGCKQLCDSNNKGNRVCACRPGFVLHPDDHDCKEENPEGKLLHFHSHAQPNGSVMFSWNVRGGVVPSGLTGFYFKATSPNHTILITLPPTSTSIAADQLRGNTEYDITLWPFYKTEGASDEKLGKPSMLSVHTPVSVPTAPTAVIPWPEFAWRRPTEVTITIYEPEAWNSKPLGYRLRLEPTDDGEPKEHIIKLEDHGYSVVNVPLSVKPGRRYTVFVSAWGIGDMGETLVGPETMATFGNISLAPVKLRAKVEIADPTSAVLSWECPKPASQFEITVSMQGISQGDNNDGTISAPNLYLITSIPSNTNKKSHSHQEEDMAFNSGRDSAPSGEEVVSPVVLRSRGQNVSGATIFLDGNSLAPSNYTVPLFGLVPNRNYDVRLLACAIDGCSDESSMTFRTPPSSIPAAIITKIFAKGTSSIYIEWSFNRPEDWLEFDLHFQVRAHNNGFFRLITTTELALTISDLTAGTEYRVEVRPSLQVSPGRRQYGIPTGAVVSTWPLVPRPPTLTTKGFTNAPGVVALSWVFVNSTVVDVEVAINSSEFVNCTLLSSCEVVILGGWNSSFKAGFVKISGLNANTDYAVDLRGCNDHGCGYATRVYVTTGISAPSEPLELHLDTEGNMTVVLAWEPPAEPAGPLEGYMVSWECDDGSTMAATTTECFLILQGLQTQYQGCSFSVSAYHVGGNGEELYGNPATLTAQ
ncbi:uncharacterized protein LOC144138817 [Haemaphysalis longicornis]